MKKNTERLDQAMRWLNSGKLDFAQFSKRIETINIEPKDLPVEENKVKKIPLSHQSTNRVTLFQRPHMPGLVELISSASKGERDKKDRYDRIMAVAADEMKIKQQKMLE